MLSINWREQIGFREPLMHDDLSLILALALMQECKKALPVYKPDSKKVGTLYKL